MTTARILIVEDEAIVAADLADRIVTMGHIVVGTAANASKAMEMAVTSHPDLVLMDIHIKGGMDGIDLAALMWTSMELPVVFLTAYADDATLQRATSAQPYGYLLKPVNERELKATIGTSLARNRAEQKRLREDRNRASTLLSLPQAVVALDESGCVLFANPAALTMLGRSLEEMVGRTVIELLGLCPPDAGSRATHSIAVADGKTVQVDVKTDAAVQLFPTDPAVVLTLTPRE